MKLSTLLGSPCIVTLAVAAAPALADTTISKDSTTPLDTLSAGNILIKKDAELSVATGAAITVNSSNTVTVEDDDSDDSDDEPGQITAGKADGATGVLRRHIAEALIYRRATAGAQADFDRRTMHRGDAPFGLREDGAAQAPFLHS